jgi:hypothetical protein
MIMTEPIEEIHPRQEDPEIEKLLIEFSKGIEEVVNFGTHVLKWEVTEATGTDENIPVAMMLRHFLEMMDAVSILVRKSSIDPCKPLLRGILETFFGLEYILEADTKNRALAFLIWHYHKDLKLSKKLTPGEQSYNQLKSKLNQDKTLSGQSNPPSIPGLDKHILNLEKLISLPLYDEVEKEYQSLIASGRKNPAWHQLFNGPENIEQLANHLKRQGLYEVLYRSWSGPTHGTDIITSKLSQSAEGHAEIVQIRYVKDAQMVTQFAFTLGIMVYQLLTDKRIPNHKLNVANWYLTVQQLYMKLTNEKLIVVP